jgi:hypothetical protein
MLALLLVSIVVLLSSVYHGCVSRRAEGSSSRTGRGAIWEELQMVKVKVKVNVKAHRIQRGV